MDNQITEAKIQYMESSDVEAIPPFAPGQVIEVQDLESKKQLAASLKEALKSLNASIVEEEFAHILKIPEKYGGIAKFFQSQFEWEFDPSCNRFLSRPLTEDAEIYQSSLLQGTRAGSPETWRVLYAALGLTNFYREYSCLYFQLENDCWDSWRALCQKLPELKIVFDLDKYHPINDHLQKQIENLETRKLFLMNVFIAAGKDSECND